MTELDAARERLLAGLAMAERYNADRVEFGERGDAICFDDIRTLLALSEKSDVLAAIEEARDTILRRISYLSHTGGGDE